MSDTLNEVPLFAGLSDEGLRRLRECGELEAPAGKVLTREDDAAAGAFVLLEGTVEVELRGRSFELGPGQVVGELALLVPEASRVARVRAATHVRCIPVPRNTFLELVESEPAFALALLREIARRLVEVHSG